MNGDTLKEFFKNQRLEKEMTQMSFADLFNISQSQYGAFEKGRSIPNFDTIVYMLRVLGYEFSIVKIVSNEEVN